MMKLMASVAAVAMGLACTTAWAGPAKFVSAPTSARDGDKVVVSFAVDQETDVTVSIVDADGRTVRRLASGVLGATAPAPLAAGSLKQRLVWDGTDDAGKPVAPDGCKAVVSLGLRAEFDRLIGYEPQFFGTVNALAAGPDGLLYVYDNGHILVLDRQGKYVRQILPHPPGTEASKLAGLDPVTLPDGSLFHRRRYPEHRHSKWVGREIGSMAISPDGAMLYLPGPPRYARNLTRIGTDGSVPANAWDTRLTTLADNGYLFLACSPDGRTLYMAGAETGYMGDDRRDLSFRQAVYRLRLDSDGPSEVFTGDDENSGRPGFSVNRPKGLATDPAGRLYVCNFRGNNIAVYTPGAGLLRSYEIKQPQQIAVNPKTGHLYVLCGSESGVFRYGYNFPPTMHDARIVQLSPEGEVVKELELDPPYLRTRLDPETREPVTKPEFNLRMAVDFSQPDRPVVWVGVASPSIQWAKWGLLRIEDQGEQFGEPKDVVEKGTTRLQGSVTRFALDRDRDILYLNAGATRLARYRGDGTLLEPLRLTDESGQPLNVNVAEHAIGPDGMIYFSAWGQSYHRNNTLWRTDREGKAVPFPAGTPTLHHILKGGGAGSSRGFTVTPTGEMFALYYDDVERPEDKTPAEPWDRCMELPTALAKFAADGSVVNMHQVYHFRRGAQGVRVDSRGNIYVADNFMPVGVGYPADIARVTEDPLKRSYPARLTDASIDPLLRWIGCVLKFGPEGGKVVGLAEGGQHPPAPTPAVADLYRPVPAVQWFLYNYHNLGVAGAQWQFHGISPMPAHYQGVTHVERCVCTGARFDVDRFDRVFVPDVTRNRVTVLDSAGNTILRFGQYGTRDSTTGPQIGLLDGGWIAANDDSAYIGDSALGRIVRVRLGYAVQADCALTP